MSVRVGSWDNDYTIRDGSRRDWEIRREESVHESFDYSGRARWHVGAVNSRGRETRRDATTRPIKVGDMAPDFTLTDQNGNKVSLHDFKGKKNVALAFYIFAFTGG